MGDTREARRVVLGLADYSRKTTTWVVGVIGLGVVAGCASTSAPPSTSGNATVQPAASVPAGPAGLTGIGASKAAWVAAHHGLDGGAFSAVKLGKTAGQPITGMRLRFAPVREGIARFNAESQLPADVKVAGSTPSTSCLRVHYTSQLLARESAVGPDVYAYFTSGPRARGFPYNNQRVNSVVLTGSPSLAGC